ncbi:hemerythrin domain-containing protein [Erythrobacter donghaensis]|jgi:iron-sulfur cluster repair protein YtfE (RIC family)|uniref:hemerythrin domain-containing protein n=1 Tax=Erythrobacter donghaensis TaxID=267135 RepID=UPI00093F37C3|nr:hemerythrin domain-containing protein [Erythrobacter donghaensis]
MPRTSARSHARKARNQEPSSFIATAARSVLVTAGVAAIANLGRKAMTQAPTAMARDWCEGLTREHEATLAAIDKLMATSAEHPQRRTMQLTAIKHMITKHALQEENVIYPMIAREAADATGELNKEHGEVKAMLFELTRMDKADPGFATTLAQLRSALEEHMREEEDELFPALRERLSDEENRKLTRAMNMAGVMVA